MIIRLRCILFCLLFAALPFNVSAQSVPGELIAPLDKSHNHGSCIVEYPNGDILACWYRGSGERQADDVKILGARLKRGAKQWSEPFEMADTLGFPDCNPCMIVDGQKRLWLFWPVILDNHWESALLKYQTSRDYSRDGAPKWESEKTLLLKPGPEFEDVVKRDLAKQWQPYMDKSDSSGKEKLKAFLEQKLKYAGNKLNVRLGWMPRVHPFLDGNRLLLPLYSDGFDFSLVAYTDNAGASWSTSEPLVGPGNVQPSIVKRKDGTLVAFFRDNGLPPQRAMKSESKDRGRTWSLATDTDLPNPGSGLEAVVLKSGKWLIVNNPTERGRHALAIHISEDEGKTWTQIRYLENDSPGDGAGSYSYPSVIQTRDGSIHVSYSFRPNRKVAATLGSGETIRHARFSEKQLLEGWAAK